MKDADNGEAEPMPDLAALHSLPRAFQSPNTGPETPDLESVPPLTAPPAPVPPAPPAILSQPSRKPGSGPSPTRVTPDPSGQGPRFPPAPRVKPEPNPEPTEPETTVQPAVTEPQTPNQAAAPPSPPAPPTGYLAEPAARATSWPTESVADGVVDPGVTQPIDAGPASYLVNAELPEGSVAVGESVAVSESPAGTPPATTTRTNRTLAIMGLVGALTLLVGGWFLLNRDDGSDVAQGPDPDGETIPVDSTPDEADDGGTGAESNGSTSSAPSTSSPSTIQSPTTSPVPTTTGDTPATTAAPTTESASPQTTTRAPSTTESSPVRDGRIIDELARPVRLYQADTFSSTVLSELRVATPLVILERDRGWYRVEVNGATGWVYGAYVTPAAQGFANFISIDGSLLEPLNLAGEPIAGTYRGGKYAFGQRTPVNGRIEIFLPSGRMATVDANLVREIRR